MTEERTIYVFDFSPDGGKTYFPLCDARGFRVWSSAKALPSSLVGWRTTLRYVEKLMEFDSVPENFVLGTVGTHMRQDEGQEWLPDRTKVEIVFTTGAGGFYATLKSGGHDYWLKRPSEIGEPIWKLIADAIEWFRQTLKTVEPRGVLARDCEARVKGRDIGTGEDGEQVIGSELRLDDFLNAWMTTTGNQPWSET